MLALEDLKSLTEDQIKEHIAKNYGKEDYGRIGGDPEVEAQMQDLEVLIAYESVGSWGCDSSSFFLFKQKDTGKLFEVSGSHCSCYGFENQFKLEETVPAALKLRSEKGWFFTGGYDEDRDSNISKVNDFINSLTVS